MDTNGDWRSCLRFLLVDAILRNVQVYSESVVCVDSVGILGVLVSQYKRGSTTVTCNTSSNESRVTSGKCLQACFTCCVGGWRRL